MLRKEEKFLCSIMPNFGLGDSVVITYFREGQYSVQHSCPDASKIGNA
jgi:hypothetical protein